MVGLRLKRGLGSGQHTHGGGQSQLSFPWRSQGQNVAPVPAGLQQLSSLVPISAPFPCTAPASTGLQTRAGFVISHLSILPLDTAWLCGSTRSQLCPCCGGCGMCLAGPLQGCCSPHHTRGNQSPALKAPRSAEVLPAGSARAALLLLCLNAGPFVDSEAPTP